MLFEVEAFDDLLETLNPDLRQQLRTLVLELKILGGSMASDKIKRWQQEENLRKIFQTAPEFLCRGKIGDYFFKNEYVEGVKLAAAKMGFSLKSKNYQKNCFYDGARRNLPTVCWLLESKDGLIEFLEEENNPAVKILFFVTAQGGNYFQLKRLISAAQELLLVGEKNLLYGTVLETESDIHPFKSKKLLERNLSPMKDGLSRLHHLYLKLGAENLDEAAALHAQEEAKRLLDEQQSEFEYSRAAIELAEAVARIRVIEQLRQRRA